MENNVITIITRNDWRKWLKKNHKKESKVCIILNKKHTGKPTMSHKESMEEAICFGWIDTTIKKLDEDRYMRCFSKRTKNSRWSENTLRYAKDLKTKGLMSPFGLEMYEQGLSKPTHDSGVPKNPSTPEDLIKELERNSLSDIFDSLSPSTKKMYNRRLYSAKRQETRQKRIKEIIELLKQGKKTLSKIRIKLLIKN